MSFKKKTSSGTEELQKVLENVLESKPSTIHNLALKKWSQLKALNTDDLIKS